MVGLINDHSRPSRQRLHPIQPPPFNTPNIFGTHPTFTNPSTVGKLPTDPRRHLHPPGNARKRPTDHRAKHQGRRGPTMDQDARLVPTQGRRPEDLIEGPMIRRLCICRYQCPLCMENHEVQLYISLPAADLDEYVAQLKKHASRWEVMQPALTGATIEFHERQGDLPELARRAEGRGLPQTTPPHPGTYGRKRVHLRPLLQDLRLGSGPPRPHGAVRQQTEEHDINTLTGHQPFQHRNATPRAGRRRCVTFGRRG